ncbi:hypothetical protein FHS78_002072 [Parvibaculum indicum]|nr:hypothetical protein [Parvibaculum indicum]NIJ41782.1 hypothetical protein [Parvibaculum indicum]
MRNTESVKVLHGKAKEIGDWFRNSPQEEAVGDDPDDRTQNGD